MLNFLKSLRWYKKNNRNGAKNQKKLLIMKLIFLFTCAFIINVTASVYSQNTQFTFSIEGKTIKDVYIPNAYLERYQSTVIRDNCLLFPIPEAQLQIKSVLTQNPGY